MNVNQIRKSLNATIAKEIAPLFVAESYRKRQNTFFRVEQGIVKFADLEFFRFNTPIRTSFWFNWHLFDGVLPAVRRVDSNVLLTHCTPALKKRLGYLWGEENHMYTLETEDDLSAVCTKMKHDIAHHLLPLFRTIKTSEDIVNFLIAENRRKGGNMHSYMVAVLLAKVGKKEESAYFLNDAPIDLETKKRVARFYELDIG